MKKKESEVLEFRKSLSQLKEGIIGLSSMLNKHHKGELLFGIQDDGTLLGVKMDPHLLDNIRREIKSNLRPLPKVLIIQEVQENGISYVRVYVEGKDTPYSSYGRYYIRISDSDVLMSLNELQNFFEKKEDNYSRWEEIETPYTIDDIDEDLLMRIIREANEKGRIDYVYKNAEETLKKLDLLTENKKLKMAGYYLFSKNKPLTIKLANYPTDTRVDFGEIKEFKGNIFECIETALSYIQNHISYRSDIIGIERIETPEIPIRAIREIVLNSFAHCKYEMQGDYHQYIIYRSSIVIYNPGSIYKNVDPLKFASAEIGSKVRNILISSVFYKCGYIDAFGTGFDRTFTLCAKNNVKYHYSNDEFGFKFVFERKKDFLSMHETDKIHERLTSFDENLIRYILENKYITIPDLARKLKKSQATIYRHIEKLTNKNKIRRVGSRKVGYWEIID